MPQKKRTPLNVFSSQTCYDPNSRDRNNYTAISDPKERNARIVELLHKYDGQVLRVVNIATNEVRNWLITGWAGRVHITHLLFGDWRFATAEDIARHDAKAKAELERITKAEALRLALASGLVMKEMAGTAAAITKLNEMTAKETSEPPEPSKEIKAVIAGAFAERAAAQKKRGRKPKAVTVTA